MSAKKVHIRMQQRNGRKFITTIQGLDDDIDKKRLLKAFKTNFSCDGCIKKKKDAEGETVEEVIQLSGDKRVSSKAFLVDQEIYSAEQVFLYG